MSKVEVYIFIFRKLAKHFSAESMFCHHNKITSQLINSYLKRKLLSFANSTRILQHFSSGKRGGGNPDFMHVVTVLGWPKVRQVLHKLVISQKWKMDPWEEKAVLQESNSNNDSFVLWSNLCSCVRSRPSVSITLTRAKQAKQHAAPSFIVPDLSSSLSP